MENKPRKPIKERAQEDIDDYTKWHIYWPVPEKDLPNFNVHWSDQRNYLPKGWPTGEPAVNVPLLGARAQDIIRHCLYYIQELDDRVSQLEEELRAFRSQDSS